MCSIAVARLARAVTVIVILIALGPAALEADTDDRVIRILSPALTAALADLEAGSPEARALIDRLEASDLLIHVVAMSVADRRGFAGTTRFITRAGGRRILRLTVDTRLPREQRAAALAHELQHAAEVAGDAGVIDHASFGAFYRRIGYESGRDLHRHCFETTAARRVGRQVLTDLQATARAARRERQSGPTHGSQ